MRKTRFATTSTLLSILLLTACSGASDSSNQDVGGIKIPSFFKSLSEQDKSDFTTSMEQTSALFQETDISSQIFNQALSDIERHGFQSTGGGLQKSDFGTYQREIRASLSKCAVRSRTIRDPQADIVAKNIWVESKDAATPCSADFSGSESSASSMIDGSKNQSFTSDKGLNLNPSNLNLKDKDFVSMTTSQKSLANTQMVNPKDESQRSSSQSESTLKVSLETKDGVKTSLELGQTRTSTAEKRDDRGALPNSTTKTVLVFYGSLNPGAQNPVVYERTDLVSDQETKVTIKINGEVVFQQPKEN